MFKIQNNLNSWLSFTNTMLTLYPNWKSLLNEFMIKPLNHLKIFKKELEALIKLATQMQGSNFGLTSTWKSTMINTFIHSKLSSLWYSWSKWFSVWKGLTARIIVVTATIKELTKVFRNLKGVNHIRYVSAKNSKQFPYLIRTVDCLTKTN
jgi:hypothetical protein